MGDIRAGLEELKLDVALFTDVKFYISGEADPKILSLLQRGGAERSTYFCDFVTHLIAGYEADEAELSEAKDLYEIPAVTQDWVLNSAKCNKLLPTKFFSAEENQLFSPIRACISEVSQADSKALWAMIFLQGGKCQLRLNRSCTHLIVGRASGAKYETAMKQHITIVTPDWIVDCCRKKKLVPEAEYHPRLLMYPSPNSSTALITGFMDEDGGNISLQDEQERTKSMLEHLKQRMPWNQLNSGPSSHQTIVSTSSTNQIHQQQSHNPISINSGQNQQQLQQQQQQTASLPQQLQQSSTFQRITTSTSLPNYQTAVSTSANQNWHNQQQVSQVNTTTTSSSSPQVKIQVSQHEQLVQAQNIIHQQQINAHQQIQGNNQMNSQQLQGNNQMNPQPISGNNQMNPQPISGNNSMNSQSISGNNQMNSQRIVGNNNQMNHQQISGNNQMNSQPIPVNNQLAPQQISGNNQMNSQQISVNNQMNSQQIQGNNNQLNSQQVSGNSQLNSQQIQGNNNQLNSQQMQTMQTSFPQQIINSQPSPIMTSSATTQINQQSIMPRTQQQNLGNLISQQKLSQPQQLGISQTQMTQGTQQLVTQQAINQQMPQTQMNQQPQIQSTMTNQQINLQNISQQQMSQQAQNISQQQSPGQQQLTQQMTIQSQIQNQTHQSPQQLTPEQRQLILIQQQKIQQISQQLQQSAPQQQQQQQPAQPTQFIIRDGQLQQQAPNQIMNQNQQSIFVNREAWQQQQYHLQMQRQQQAALGQQRPGGQWTQQPPQQPRQLIQLDAQTHQQLQQMDPQQRAQFIQKIQKQRNIIMQRQMQNRPAQQGPHAAVIRSSVNTAQAGVQWVQQRPQQMMGPQLPTAVAQKPMHPGVQPPALTPINPPNQVIVPASGPVQVSQTSAQTGQAVNFQQGQQLTPQQIAQLHMQKQQIARLQHLQQQAAQQQQQQQAAQQQQVVAQQQQQQQNPAAVQQEQPPLTPLSVNSQIPPDQQLVVNAKTKTALANMLTNRIQGGGATEGSAAGQLRLMTAQHRPPPPPSQDPALLAAYQRRTLGNLTNGTPQSGMKMQYAPSMPQPKAQFYGHNPNLKLPPDLFLLGCIFVIVEYEATYSTNEVTQWKQVIERHGGEIEPQYCARATHVLAITQKHPTVIQALREGKRCVSAHWLSDIVIKQKVVPPWHALHFPIPFSLNERPCITQNVSFSGFEGDERTKLKAMLDVLGIKYTKYFSHHNTLLICRRNDGPKYKKAREWQTPIVNGQWLTDLICGQVSTLHQIDTPKYQQLNLNNSFRFDSSLVPHLMAAWKSPINVTQESYDKVKQVGQGPNAMRKYKKPRLEGPLPNKDPHLLGLDEPIVISNPDPPSPEKQPRILFSGTSPEKHAKRIRELGGALAANWRDATHLVMTAPFRTVKLLCCLSRCKFIVNIQWLQDCYAKNSFVDETPYVLGNPEFEKSFHCNIEKALASPNRGSVLKGKIFYVTPSVVPSPAAFGEIIESAGGIMEKNRRSLVQIQEMNAGKLNYIIVTQENDLHLLSDVLGANINVFSAEEVLRAIARQNFQSDAN